MYDPLTEEELQLIRDGRSAGGQDTPKRRAHWLSFLWIALVFVLFVVGAYFIVYIGTKG